MTKLHLPLRRCCTALVAGLDYLGVVQHNTAQSMAQNNTAQSSREQHITAQYSEVQCSTVQNNTV